MSPTPQPALIWRRSDFSETSRLVTLITRDEGKVKALAKGAHRATSPFLGRIDHLNLVLPRFARRLPGSLQLLRGVKLLHEHRALRAPRRFAACSYLCEIFDVAFLEGRADPPLFDLLLGALRVLERCPERALTTAVTGIELRFLAQNGVLPDLRGCSDCGRAGGLHLAAYGRGLLCSQHRSGATQAVPGSALQWLQRLEATPGRDWAGLTPPGRAVRSILGQWIADALERRPRWRAQALAQELAPQKAIRPGA